MTIYDMNQIVPVRQMQLQLQKVTVEQKSVTVERKTSAAYGCRAKTTLSFPNLKSIWCTDHTRAIVFDFQPPPPRTRWQAFRARRSER